MFCASALQGIFHVKFRRLHSVEIIHISQNWTEKSKNFNLIVLKANQRHRIRIKMVLLGSVLSKFYDEYQSNTPKKLKIIDAYLVYILLTGIMQFVYCVLVGTFPFNSFLSGFISCVSCFVLAGEMSLEWIFVKIF